NRALDQTREIDGRLVDAQETRRILDRLYGYEVSPVLWKKIMRGLSAGRVQSVATRLVVEREEERRRFRAATWSGPAATFGAALSDEGSFEARLVSVDGRRVAQGRDFDNEGAPRSPDVLQLNEADARGLAERLQQSAFSVSRREQKPYSRRPSAPFMTS